MICGNPGVRLLVIGGRDLPDGGCTVAWDLGMVDGSHEIDHAVMVHRNPGPTSHSTLCSL